MKVLVVCRYKEHMEAHVAPFVAEQVDALRNLGVEFQLFRVNGKGAKGYMKQLRSLKEIIKDYNPDLVHAHYGLCGLLACLQRKVPVVTTYHGSDINDPKVCRLSKIAMRLSAWNIFVSPQLVKLAKPKRRFTLLPCGVNMTDLQLTPKPQARQQLRLEARRQYVLFAGAFDNAVKNAPLAHKAVELLDCSTVELLELKGYSREEVTLLMCAADAFLMTSFSEGSPQVIKEALACGCPIVSVDVGDVKERIGGVEGCFVARSRNPKELSEMLGKAFLFEGKTRGREKVEADGLDNNQIAEKLIALYNKTVFAVDKNGNRSNESL